MKAVLLGLTFILLALIDYFRNTGLAGDAFRASGSGKGY